MPKINKLFYLKSITILICILGILELYQFKVISELTQKYLISLVTSTGMFILAWPWITFKKMKNEK